MGALGTSGPFPFSACKSNLRVFSIVFMILAHIVLSVARLVGVGEASFISLAAPFIDDNAPDTQVYFFPLR